MQILGYLALAAPLVVATSQHHGRYGNKSTHANPDLGYDRLLQLQHGFWKRFLYPNNLREALSINSTIFADDVQGRVSDSRNFDGRELNTEYIFGLFIPNDAVSIIGLPTGPYEVKQFAANQNIASASTVVYFSFPAFGNITLPVTMDTWFTWNAAGQITQYDAVFRWFAYLVETLLSLVDPTADLATAQAKARAAIARSVCDKHARYCTGADQQYDSSAACYAFLTHDVRLGQSFELGRNTLLCRNVHENMLAYRPAVHCPHVGPSGGGMCDDATSYVQTVEQTYFTNAPFVPTDRPHR